MTISNSHPSYLFKNKMGASSLHYRVETESHSAEVADAEKAVKEIQEEIFTSVFDSIVNFVSTAAAQAGPLIPTAVLLTGVSKSSLFLDCKQMTIGKHTS